MRAPLSNRLLALGTAALLAACAGEPAAPALPALAPGAAQIVVYRPHTAIKPEDYPFVYVDDARKGTLADGGVVRIEVAPGPHRITLSNPALWEGRQYWQANAIAGRRLYYRLRSGEFPDEDTVSARYLSSTTRVDQVADDEAQAEIQALEQPAPEADTDK